LGLVSFALAGTMGGVEKTGSGLNCTDFGIFGIFKFFPLFG
jgi:hypothetical protein